jgi:hypothetical protein
MSARRLTSLIQQYRDKRNKRALKKLSTKGLIHTLRGWIVAADDVLDGFLRFRVTLEDIVEELQRRLNMSTIQDESIILEMLLNEGSYEGDPVPDRIYKYEHSMSRKTLYAVFYRAIDCDIHVAPLCKKPVLLWDEEGLTAAGLGWLKEKGHAQKTVQTRKVDSRKAGAPGKSGKR